MRSYPECELIVIDVITRNQLVHALDEGKDCRRRHQTNRAIKVYLSVTVAEAEQWRVRYRQAVHLES